MLVVGASVAWFAWHRTRALPELTQLQLTANSVEEPVISGAISPDGKYLAYTDLSGIHIKLSETGKTRTIPQPETFGGGRVEWRIASWFPGSTRFLANVSEPGRRQLIAWLSFPKLNHPGVWTVTMMSGAPRKLRDDAYAWSVSPDGTSVAFTTKAGWIGDREIWLMDSDGAHPRKLWETDENSDFRRLQWSPDGQRLAYIRRHLWPDKLDVFVESRDLRGGAATTLLSEPGLHDFCWLPDGRMIYSSGKQSPNGATCNFWEVEMDTQTGRVEGKPRRLTNWAGSCMDSLSVTQEGGRLAFKKWSGETSVYVADLEVNETKIKNPRRLPLNEGWYIPTTWTADSKAVVFESHRSGQWGLFKLPVDENAAQLIVSGTETEDNFLCPRVSPDGEWVLYQAPSTSLTLHLMRAPITGGTPQPVLTASSLIDCVRCARSPSSLCAIGQQTPDNRQLIFTAFDPVKGIGGELIRFDVDDPNDSYGFALSPDGTHIAVVQFQTGSFYILSLKGEATREFTVKNWNNGGDWAADGKGLFVSRATERGSALVYVDLRGNIHVVWDVEGDFEGSVGLSSPDGRRLILTRDTFSSKHVDHRELLRAEVRSQESEARRKH